MKFSIGDLVRVKKTGEEGTVRDILEDDMFEVNINGTVFPVYKDEIEHPYLHWFLQKQKVNKVKKSVLVEDLPAEKKKKKQDLVHHQPGFSLQFLPEYEHDGFEEVVTRLKVYLINQSIYHIYIDYRCELKIGSFFSLKTDILPFQTFYLHDIPYSIMQEQPEFKWIIFTDKKEKGPRFEDSLRIKPKKLFEYLNRIHFLNEPTFSLQIAAVEQPDTAMEAFTEPGDDMRKEEFEDIFSQPALPAVKYEIDLHIEKLDSRHKYMDAFEKLSVQLQAFEQAMNDAIRTQQDHLTIIHGVGNGKLKQEIHKLLRVQYEAYCYFVHDYMPRYGMGATQVIFRK